MNGLGPSSGGSADRASLDGLCLVWVHANAAPFANTLPPVDGCAGHPARVRGVRCSALWSEVSKQSQS
jgi:hypothetical protein